MDKKNIYKQESSGKEGSEKELCEKCLKEKQISDTNTSGKKDVMRDRNVLYSNIERTDDKLNVNMIRSLKNSLLALYYQDKLQIRFKSRDVFSYEEADNLNNIIEFDYDESDMAMYDYENQGNRIDYGVGIRVITGRDDENKRPCFKVMSPLSRYPDPEGRLHVNYFRFMGFETSMSIDEIKNKKDWKNTEQVNAGNSTEEDENDYGNKKGRYLPNVSKELSQATGTTTIYYHYTTFDGKPYQCIFRNDVLLSSKVIEPLEVTDNKGKKYKYKFPVSLNYYEPKKGDPWGICLYDIAEDKQKIKTLMLNLMRIKATREALGGQYFLDRNVLASNKQELLKPNIGPQYIPVNTNGLPIQNFIYPVPQDQISPDVYQLPGILDQIVENDLGLSKQTMGMDDGRPKTATEVQTTQVNANINLMLGNRVNARGEKTFWSIWYLFYKHFFSFKDKKFVRLNKGIVEAGDILERLDFIHGTDPDVQVAYRSEIDAQNAKESQMYLALLPNDLADPQIPECSKRYMKRKAKRLLGMTQNEIDVMIPPTPEELEAKMHILLLNQNIPVEIADMDEDHLTFIMIYQSAIDTPAKKTSIEARKEAYIKSGQRDQQKAIGQGQQMQGQGAMGNSMGSQMMGNAMQTAPQNNIQGVV